MRERWLLTMLLTSMFDLRTAANDTRSGIRCAQRARHAAPWREMDRLEALAARLLDGCWARVSLAGCSGGEREPTLICRAVLATGEPVLVEDLGRDERFRADPGARGRCGRAYAGVPLRLDSGVVAGVLRATARRPRRWNEEDLSLLQGLSGLAAAQLDLRRSLDAIGTSVLADLLGALRDGPQASGADDTRLGRLAVETARRLRVEEDELQVIQAAAQLHEAGRQAGPDVILGRPSAVDEEWDAMRCQATIGRHVLAACPELGAVGDLVRAASERYDGSGHPDGVRGERIPLAARVIAVCHAFDALTSRDAQAGALPTARALAELRRGAGRRFDPRVVEAFSAVVEPGEEAATAA